MEFDIFDNDTRRRLQSADVEVPRTPLPSLSDDEWDELVANHPEMLAGPPADPDDVTTAFGHWAEDGGTRESEASPSPSEAPVQGTDDVDPAHPPIDVRGWTEQEIRDFYQGQMDEDWAHAETYNEQMNQDLQDHLAYEATGVHDTWETVKEIGLGIGSGIGLAGLAEGLGWPLQSHPGFSGCRRPRQRERPDSARCSSLSEAEHGPREPGRPVKSVPKPVAPQQQRPAQAQHGPREAEPTR